MVDSDWRNTDIRGEAHYGCFRALFFVCLFLIDSAGKDCWVWLGEHSATAPRMTAQASHGELGLQH